MKNNSSKFASDKERLAAIHRTLEETAPLPDLDIKTLVSRSIEAYWDRREVMGKQESQKLERDTATIARSLAKLLRLGRAQENPRVEFWSDFGMAAAPVCLAVPIIYLFSSRGILGPNLSPYILLIARMVILSIILGFIVFRKREGLGRLWILRHSAGSLAGGFLAVALVTFLPLSEARRTTDVSLAFGEDVMGAVALSSLGAMKQTGSFLRSSVQSGLVSLQTEQISGESVIYKARTKGLPGMLIANLGHQTGKLYWQRSGKQDLRAHFAVGTVKEVDQKSITLTFPGGKNIRLTLSDKTFAAPVAAGTNVAIAFEPEKNTVIKIEKIK